eukprot:6466085-Amphidinium_carterae.2
MTAMELSNPFNIVPEKKIYTFEQLKVLAQVSLLQLTDRKGIPTENNGSMQCQCYHGDGRNARKNSLFYG